MKLRKGRTISKLKEIVHKIQINDFMNEFAEEITEFSERELKKAQKNIIDILSKIRDKDIFKNK